MWMCDVVKLYGTFPKRQPIHVSNRLPIDFLRRRVARTEREGGDLLEGSRGA